MFGRRERHRQPGAHGGAQPSKHQNRGKEEGCRCVEWVARQMLHPALGSAETNHGLDSWSNGTVPAFPSRRGFIHTGFPTISRRPVEVDQAHEEQAQRRMPLTLGTLGGVFVSGAARAARFSDCNTGRLAPCRYKEPSQAQCPRGFSTRPRRGRLWQWTRGHDALAWSGTAQAAGKAEPAHSRQNPRLSSLRLTMAGGAK